MKKMALQREGYNPEVITDPLFFYDSVKGAYRSLDSCVYNDIMEMRMRIWWNTPNDPQNPTEDKQKCYVVDDCVTH